jgi:Flp pilus assembly protein TadB
VNSSLFPVLLSVIGTLGVLLIAASLTLPKSAFKRIEQTGSGPRLAEWVDDIWVTSLLSDISRRISAEGGLKDRLRRSGWIYASAEEFHSRRMLLTVTYLALGVGASVLSASFLGHRMPPSAWPIIGTLAGLYGFTLPNRILNRAIQRRKDRMVMEMGFGLERVALLLQSGADIAEALSSAGNLGLFGVACRRLASGISMGRSITEISEELREELPNSPQFDEFLGMLGVSIHKGAPLVDPFRARAASARGKLRLDIIEAGQRAKIKVVLLTSMVILLASIIVTVLPTLLLLMEEGMF